MSIAGIRSNRGDYYQKLVAFDWALSVLTKSDYQWLEIDSISNLVDDIVVGKSDGSTIGCQCKKNQADFKSWSMADLEDELDKAIEELTRSPNAKIRFYSRSDFGSLAKLREASTAYANEADYNSSLTSEHKKTDAVLTARIAAQASGLSTYEFLCRTSFHTSEDVDRMEDFLRERLRQVASNSDAAFNAIWLHLEKLGGRIEDGTSCVSSQHRLTKDDLKQILHLAGAMLVPAVPIAQVRTSFASTSAIGRSWQRTIAGHHLPSPVVKDLLAAIDDRVRSVLLTGPPGSGKTVVVK